LRVGIIGAGVVGAAIAYELSHLPGVQIQVFDQRSPQTFTKAATGAALGVLIAVASSKRTSQHLQLRLESLQRFDTLIPELDAALAQAGISTRVHYNRQGILELCFEEAAWSNWAEIATVRRQQGWSLERLSVADVVKRYPELQTQGAIPLVGAVYSPNDRQVDPVALTQALMVAAQQRGVAFIFETPVQHLKQIPVTDAEQRLTHLVTSSQEYALDWLIIAAGVGSQSFIQDLDRGLDAKTKVNIQPVLGQALQLRLPQPQTWLHAWPVIQGAPHKTGVHLVPINSQELWVGATVEFPAEDASQLEQVRVAHPNPDRLAMVREQAIDFCPRLKDAEVVRTWSGLRPRPVGRPAPIIEPLPGCSNVILATGHYRNGVLLAPVTSQKVFNYLQQYNSE
jgi:glycine oxidase